MEVDITVHIKMKSTIKNNSFDTSQLMCFEYYKNTPIQYFFILNENIR